MFKRICGWITTAAVAIVVIFAILLVGVRVVGYTPFVVLSPSMSPLYRPGDLVYVHAKAPEKIRVGEDGDVMTFSVDGETVVTHRAVDVDPAQQCFYTKGDANSIRDDAPVPYDAVIGVVAFSIPKLGFFSNFLGTRAGMFTMIAVFCFMLILFILPEVFKPEDKKDKTAPPVGDSPLPEDKG